MLGIARLISVAVGEPDIDECIGLLASYKPTYHYQSDVSECICDLSSTEMVQSCYPSTNPPNERFVLRYRPSVDEKTVCRNSSAVSEGIRAHE